MKLIWKIIYYFLIIISLLIFSLYAYIYSQFSNITLEQLIYSFFYAEGADSSVIIRGFLFVLTFFLIALVIRFIFKKIKEKYFFRKTSIVLTIFNKRVDLTLFPVTFFKKFILVTIMCVLIFIYIFVNLGAYDYLKKDNSTFIEKNYINPKNIEMTLEGKKNNLIFIYVESLESSLFSKENGGAFEKSIIPNLEKIADSNINFSQSDKLGGFSSAYGTGWTIAGMVASSSGVPLKFPVDSNSYLYNGKFLPGIYSLGDILKDNGYKNYIMFGSDAQFGGRKDYFKSHGDYAVYDHNYARNHKWIDEDYIVWWGFEDKKLFNFAKKQLTKISSKDEPFNFTLLTADTHFTDGYLDKKCETPFDKKYLNVYHCADDYINSFIDWIKKQDFYRDTTVVVVGDHLTMQSNITKMYDVANPKDYQRSVYNVFINSKVKSDNYKDRKFNTFDIFPTTLVALGFEIKGERLGLGTNLFSNKKTLSEKYGNEYINEELKKQSTFYNRQLLGSTYIKMLKDKE